MKAILRLAAAFACAVASACATPSMVKREEGVVLTGALTDEDRATYRELAFDVPPGAQSVRIRVTHDCKGKGAVIDRGLRVPCPVYLTRR